MAARHRIGDLVFDPVNRTVERAGEVVSLPALSFKLLNCLVRHAPDAVDHERLVAEVWGRDFVSPETVTQRVKLLRSVLGDESQNPNLIETLRGHGYRLIPPVAALDNGGQRQARRSTRWPAIAGATVVVVLLAYTLVSWWSQDHGAAPPSVAVLPFVNLSPDPDQAYFSDGLSDELLNLLAQIRELRVAARTSSFAFRGESADIRDIANQLNVSNVLEGSVRRDGDRIRVTAQLIEAEGGFHLWSQTYERSLEDVFAIQDDIAAQVVRALEITLLGKPPTQRQTSAEVYSLFLRARHFDNLKGEENWARAVDYFQQALAVEPDYAPAWAGLSRTYRYQAQNHVIDFDEGIALARRAAERAIELDRASAAAWANLAQIETLANGDRAAAQAAVDRAMQLEPANVEALLAAGELAYIQGRNLVAIDRFEEALARDPLNLTAHNALGIALMNAGRHQEARSAFEQLLELSPGYPWGNINYGRVLLLERKPIQALQRFEHAPSGLWRAAGTVMALDGLGRQTEADALVPQLEVDYADGGAFLVAAVYAWRGDRDRAFEWLERSFARHEPGLMFVANDPFYAGLHGDPRWAAFLERLGR